MTHGAISLEREFKGTARYELRKLLGVGAMGVVYEAFDYEHDTRVALKCLPRARPEAAIRFKNEFRSLLDLHHDNLVKLGELVHDGDQLFFTMELIEGVDIISHCWRTNDDPGWQGRTSERPTSRPEDPTLDADSLPAGPPCICRALGGPVNADEARVRSTFAQLTRGLLALHAAGMAHCDVKPSNVLVTRAGRVVLLDFSVVADLARPPLGGGRRLVGTVAYMSPEQAARAPAGRESDWYSLGVMLFEVLTGRLPFEGDGLAVLCRKQVEKPPRVRELAPGAPRVLAELCARLLEVKPTRRPQGEEILNSLELDPVEAICAVQPEPVFVGREPELAALNRAFARARAGRVSVVHVEGQSGTGKTTLLEHFLESVAAADDALLLRGRCSEREYVPYRAVDGAVDCLVGLLARGALPELGPIAEEHMTSLVHAFPAFARLRDDLPPAVKSDAGDPLVRRVRLFRALEALLRDLRAHRHVVLALDDMQWADADSLALLSAVVGSPDAPAILIVMASRPHWNDRHLLRKWGAETIRIGNLAYAESVELASALLRQAVPALELEDLAQRVASAADGHPLFVLELARATLHDAARLAAPAMLDAVLWSRVERLSASAQKLVKLAALAKSALPYTVLVRAAKLRAPAGAATPSELATLRNQHLLQFSGSESSSDVQICHDRVATAICSRLTETEKRALHAAIATALEADPGRDPEELAVHWQGAAFPQRAAEHALRAARRAETALAFERAARLYWMALECWPEQPAGDQVRESLGDALANAGLGAAAARAYLDASELVDEARRFDLERRAADQLFRSGHIDQAEPLIVRVLQYMGMRLPRSMVWIIALWILARARLALTRVIGVGSRPTVTRERQLAQLNACWSVAVGLSMVSNIRGASLQSRHLLLALRVAEPLPLVRALSAEASYVAVRGQRARRQVEQLLARADAVAAGLADPYALGFTTLSKGICSFLMGNFQESRELSEAAERVFAMRPAGAMWELASARTFGLWSKFYLGDVVSMRPDVTRFIQEAEARGDRYAATLHRTGLIAMTWLAADDPGTARQQVAEAEMGWSRADFDFPRYLHTLGHCLIDMYEGAPGLAYRRISEIWPALRRSLHLRIQNVRAEALYLRGIAAIATASAGGARGALIRDAERCARALGREDVGWARALASLLHGGISELAADVLRATSHWEAAELQARSHGMMLFATAARFRRAAALGGASGARELQALRATPELCEVREPERLCALLAPGVALG